MTSAIILAGGSSKRMGDDVDKLVLQVGSLPLIARVLLTFERCSNIDEIILVARKDRQDAYRSLALEHHISKLTSVIPGGVERQDSVWCGIQAISPNSKIVLIHDSARALVTIDIISRCVAIAQKTGAAIPAARVKDTIKRTISPTNARSNGSNPLVEATVDRSLLWAAQTPQTFRTDLIRRAYEQVIRDRLIITDDASAVEHLGHPVSIVESNPFNLKITTPEDLLLAEAFLSKQKP